MKNTTQAPLFIALKHGRRFRPKLFQTTLGTIIERFHVFTMEKLSAVSQSRTRALSEARSAQLEFAAIIAEATGGNGK